MSISPINPLSSSLLSSRADNAKQASPVEKTVNAFSDMLTSLNESQSNADTLVSQLSAGENVDLHTVMIAMEENDVNFRVAMAIRDKLVDAYREMMRMNV